MNKKLSTVLTVLLLISVFSVACRGDNAGSNEDPAQTQTAQQDENAPSSVVSTEADVDVPTPAPDSDNPDLVQSDPPDPDTPSESGDAGDDVGSGNAVETSEDGTQEPVEEEAVEEAEPTEEAMVETAETEDADAEGSADANLHIIEEGETLSLIAEQYDISADVLATYNEIDDVDSIVAGDIVRLPTGAIAAAIAQQIEQANAITTETAEAEAEPEVEETPEAVAEADEDADAAEASEDADAGDSADTEDNDEAADNDDTADAETVEAVSEEATYTVQPGDGLAYIAINYDVDIDDLAAANNLASYDDIKIGQVLTIPGIAGSGVDSAETDAYTDSVADTEDSAAEPIYHEVVFSDKLDNIAEFYEVSMESIIEANNIEDPDLIKLGQFLLIPTE